MEIDPGAAPADSEHRVHLAARTDAGTERELNEDSCGVHVESPGCALAVVADGVSSSEAGEEASRLAVEVVIRSFSEQSRDMSPGQRLYRAVQQANIEIYDKSVAVPELRGMATTLTAAVVDRGWLTVVHVGDSRLYLVRGGSITQLTKDHTLAAQKSRYGLLGKERARTHPDRCVLTRSVGRELIVSRDQATRTLVDGDALLLCSDGLYNVLSESEMNEIIEQRDVDGACRALVDRANARGTPDNVTAVVVRFSGPPGEPHDAARWTWLRRLTRSA
jgi:protein phosphatase